MNYFAQASRITLMLAIIGLVHFICPSSSAQVRAQAGLQVIYDFSEATGTIIHDRSGVGVPTDLTLHNPENTNWIDGGLSLIKAARAEASERPTKLIESIRRSGEITIEAWVQSASPDQSGPARIVTLSQNGSQRNFTLGQDGNRYDVRLRTSQTSGNGTPSLNTPDGNVSYSPTHILYTRDRLGASRLYINGKSIRQKNIGGDLSNWGKDHRFALGDEISGDRKWLGTYHLVAVYNRALSATEVIGNFRAGHRADINYENPTNALSQNEKRFQEQIAPLLSRKCLECHDSAAKKGKLDLSRRDTAFDGGRHGNIIVPGDLENSKLMESIDEGEMPKDRPPLTEDEKTLIATWIEQGADWSIATIDPADYQYQEVASENWVRRLTNSEYIATVRAMTGVDISKEAEDLLPKNIRADGFNNTAYNLTVDMKHIQAYAKLAAIIVARMDLQHLDTLITRESTIANLETNEIVQTLAPRFLRGPLSEHETNSFNTIVTAVNELEGTKEEVIKRVVESALQSPRFLYHMESQLGDGTRWPITSHELASRLSYLVWGAPPDNELATAANSGTILNPEELKRQTERLLEDPQARERSFEFVSQWLGLDRLKNLNPSREHFPTWKPRLAHDMRRETLMFFEDIAWNQNRPLPDLFNAQITFASQDLALHYGIPTNGEGFLRYDLRPTPERGGLLTHGSLLTIGGDDASTVTRGLFILRDILRGTIDNPPPGLDTTPVPSSPGISRRAIAEERVASESCGGCHIKFEPISYALEKFDGTGGYSDIDEHGNLQHENGAITFPGETKPITYETIPDFMDALAESERVALSLTWKLVQFALGRPLAINDRPFVESIHETATERRGTYQDVIVAIATSELMRTSRTEIR